MRVTVIESRDGAEIEVRLYEDGDAEIILCDEDGGQAYARLQEDKARELAAAVGCEG